jgi:hypothetical protein
MKGFWTNLFLLMVAFVSIIVAIVCGFQQRWAEGAFFWGEAVTFLVVLRGRTDPF